MTKVLDGLNEQRVAGDLLLDSFRQERVGFKTVSGCRESGLVGRGVILDTEGEELELLFKKLLLK